MCFAGETGETTTHHASLRHSWKTLGRLLEPVDICLHALAGLEIEDKARSRSVGHPPPIVSLHLTASLLHLLTAPR